jgi:hypothetical protein
LLTFAQGDHKLSYFLRGDVPATPLTSPAKRSWCARSRFPRWGAARRRPDHCPTNADSYRRSVAWRRHVLLGA